MSEAGGPGDDLSGWLRAQLLERRMVMLRGEIDDRCCAQVTAELMTLDAVGDQSIEVHVDSGGGTFEAAFPLMDTIDLLGVPVRAVCIGRAQGVAVGVMVSAGRRLAAPHARFQLCEPEHAVSGRARDLGAWAEHHQGQVRDFVRRIASATGQPFEHVEADVAAGRWFDAEQAVEYGLVQEIWRPQPGEQARRPFGFGPG